MKFGLLDSFTETTIEKKVLNGHEFVAYEARSEEELPDEIEELDGCLVWHYVKITENTLDRMKNCKVIVRIGVGFDSVDIEEAGKRGIAVCNVPDYGTNDVADHCMALLLASCRSIPAYNNALHDNVLSSWQPEIGGEIHRLTGANIGIVGMGRIGSSVAVRAKAFGMNVFFYDPYLPDGYDKAYQITRVETLEELFALSDYVSIHTPLTEETKGMIGKDLFNKVTKPITFINTARGGIVVLDDVYDALKEGKIRLFAADVLETEPPCLQHKLIKAFAEGDSFIRDKVILTPHAAFYAQESQTEMREKAAKHLADLAQGKALKNCVNTQYLVNAKAKVKGL